MMFVSVLALGLVEGLAINDLDGANNLVAPFLPQADPFSFGSRGISIYIYINLDIYIYINLYIYI
jgi:hypothetical protein